MKKKQTRLSIEREAVDAMMEIAQLFPKQDPIRLAAGIKDFKTPLKRLMPILRKLQPHFKDDNADMIRLAAGFNDMKQKIREDRAAPILAAMQKKLDESKK